MVNREVSKVKQSITTKVAIREIPSLVGYYRKFILRRGIDAVRIRICIWGLGFRVAPKARGTRSTCTRNPNPVSKSTRRAPKFFSNLLAVKDHLDEGAFGAI